MREAPRQNPMLLLTFKFCLLGKTPGRGPALLRPHACTASTAHGTPYTRTDYGMLQLHVCVTCYACK